MLRRVAVGQVDWCTLWCACVSEYVCCSVRVAGRAPGVEAGMGLHVLSGFDWVGGHGWRCGRSLGGWGWVRGGCRAQSRNIAMKEGMGGTTARWHYIITASHAAEGTAATGSSNNWCVCVCFLFLVCVAAVAQSTVQLDAAGRKQPWN